MHSTVLRSRYGQRGRSSLYDCISYRVLSVFFHGHCPLVQSCGSFRCADCLCIHRGRRTFPCSCKGKAEALHNPRAELIGFGLLITLVTWIFYPSGFVVFGVLSLIGLGTILAIPFISPKVKWFIPAAVGAAVVLAGIIVSKIYLTIPYLIPLGFKIYGFSTLDYEPLLP